VRDRSDRTVVLGSRGTGARSTCRPAAAPRQELPSRSASRPRGLASGKHARGSHADDVSAGACRSIRQPGLSSSGIRLIILEARSRGRLRRGLTVAVCGRHLLWIPGQILVSPRWRKRLVPSRPDELDADPPDDPNPPPFTSRQLVGTLATAMATDIAPYDLRLSGRGGKGAPRDERVRSEPAVSAAVTIAGSSPRQKSAWRAGAWGESCGIACRSSAVDEHCPGRSRARGAARR
jgi:hypothetical protein